MIIFTEISSLYLEKEHILQKVNDTQQDLKRNNEPTQKKEKKEYIQGIITEIVANREV